MKTNAKKRLLSYILAFLMVFTYIPAAAYATEGEGTDTNPEVTVASETGATILDGKIRIEDDFGTAAVTDNIVRITAKGVTAGRPTKDNIRIYNDSSNALILSFDYTAENFSDFSEKKTGDIVNGVGSSNGTYTAVIDPGKYEELYITGITKRQGDSSAKLALSNFTCTLIPESSEITVKYSDSLGTVTVDDNAIASGGTAAVSYTLGGILKATPVEGAKFIGWMDPDTNKFFSLEESYAIKPIEAMEIEAVFIGKDTAPCYLVGYEYLVDTFEGAMAKAGTLSDKTVVLLKDTTLKDGDYVIPAGVTLLIPFNDEYTLYTEGADAPEGTNEKRTEPTPYCRLTLADGANIVVNGALSLSAKHYAANGGGRGSGGPTGEISYLVTEENSSVTINNGGALYAYGFVTGKGTVTAKSGATVYENFQIEDFRGGEVTFDLAANQMDKGFLPISQYYVQNIEVPLRLESGAKEYVYASLFAREKVWSASVQFIGDNGAMFNIKEGHVVKKYDGVTDRLIFDVEGDLGLSPISLEMELLPDDLNSGMFDLPINSNITVNLNHGDIDISQDLALLPGSKINVAEGTTCTLTEGVNVFVYDLDQWGGYVGTENLKMIPVEYAPSRSNESARTEQDLEDATIVVNGTFDASAGYMFTTTSKDKKSGGANICSTANGVVKTSTGVAPEHYQYVQEGQVGEFVLIDLLPVNLKNADGSYVQTLETGVGTYTYEDGQWVCGHEEYNREVLKDSTCSETGTALVTCVMEEVEKGYGHKHTEVIPKKDHTPVVDMAVEATCTEPGLTEGSHCDVCGEVIVPQEVVPVLGHDWEEDKSFDKEPTCTEDGIRSTHCERCGIKKEGSEETVKSPGHTYKYDTVDATCLEDGKQTKYCTKCDIEPEEEILPKLGHSYKHFVTDPTCTEEGFTSHICSRCDDEYKDEITPAVSHSIAKVETQDAACTEAGHKQHYKCEKCEGLFSDEAGNIAVTEENIMIDKLGHDYPDEWTVDEEATCTQRGSKHRDCKRCGHVDDGVLYPVGHTEVIDEEVDATCHDTGLTAGVHCSVCDEKLIKQEVIPKLEHVTVIDKAVEATCTATGLTEGSHCKLCGDTLTAQEVVDKKDHTSEVDKAEPATCTKTGLTEGSHCKVCGEVLVKQEVIDRADHTVVVDEAVSATCTKTGLTEGSHCSVCDEVLVKQEVIDKADHTVVVDEAVSATCTKTGLTEGSHCSVCDEVIVEQEIVDLLGHDFEHFDGKDATCTENGYEPYDKCKRCDYNSYKEIPAKNHDIKKHVVEPTCTEDGYTVEYCNCGYENIIPGDKATGHKFTNYKESVHATCEKIGKEKAACDNGCGAVDVRDTALADHTPVVDPAVEATCTKEGLTEGSHCNVCEAIIVEQKPVEKKPHDTVKHEAKEATCLAKGHDAYEECKACDYTTFKETDPLGHDITKHEAKASTCTEKGHDAYETCSRCDYTTYAEKDPAGHKYGEEQYQVPTAEVDGGHYEVCSVCGDIKWNDVQTYKEYVEEQVAAVKITATAAGDTKAEEITVKWENSSDYEITYYNVFRSTTGETGTFDYIGKATSKSYVDKKATVNKTYYYKVRGYREYDGETYRTDASETAEAKIKPITASQVKATPMYGTTNYVNKGLKIMWTSPNIKVDGYQVYRSTSKNGTYKKVKTTKATTYSWTNTGLKVGKKYYYKVRGYKKVNGKTVYTKFSSKGYRYVLKGNDAKIASKIVRSDAVTAKKAYKVSSGIKVTWSKKTSIKCNRYEVWRATSKSGTYKKIGTTKNKYYTDKKAVKGKTYYYKIKGYRTFGKATAKTNYSNVVSGKR